MATYRNTNTEGDLFEKVKRYISGLGLYAKPAGGIPASDLAKWVLPSAVTDYSVGGLGYTKNLGTVTGAKMNNGFELLPDEDGVVDLGSVVTDDSGKADKSAAIGSLSLSLDNTNFKITLSGAKCDGTTFTVSNVIDLPLESVVVNGSYDSANKKVVLTLQNGSTVEFSVADLVSGLQSEITSSNMLSADLVDDSSATNKFTSASEKSTWSGKQDALVSGTNIKTINNESLLGSGNVTVGGGDSNVIESITFNGSAVPVDSNKNAAINYTAPVTSVNGSTGAVTISVPTNLSSFTDDLGSSPTHTHSQYLTSHQDLTNYVQKSLTSGLIKNDGTIDTTAYTTNTGTITSVKMNGSTVASGGEADLGTVITSHQDISGKADKSEMSVSTSGDQTTITLKSGTYATVINAHQSISGKEDTTNKVTSLSSSSTDDEYPSAKCVYDLVGDIETLLAAI